MCGMPCICWKSDRRKRKERKNGFRPVHEMRKRDKKSRFSGMAAAAAVFFLYAASAVCGIKAEAAEYYDIPPEIALRSADYSYEQMLEDIYALRREYGDLFTLKRLGLTPDDRVIFGLAVGAEDAKVKLLVQGAIHGREYITSPLVLGQAEQMLMGLRAGDESLRELLSGASVHFVPMNSPDGVAISRFGEKGIKDPELRENLRAGFLADGGGDYGYYLRRWKNNARGVDVNLNFPAGWDFIESVDRPTNDRMNRGPEPFSEEEAKAMGILVEKEEFDGVVSYHSMGDVIYWDSAHNRKKEESEAMAARVSEVTGYPYAPSSKSAGGLKDWMQCRENAVPGITLEVGSGEAPVNYVQLSGIFSKCRKVTETVLLFLKQN